MMEARFYISQSNPLYLRNFQKIIKRNLTSLELTILNADQAEVLCQAISDKPIDFILLGAAINTYENEIKHETSSR